jgi:hypothetical protein
MEQSYKPYEKLKKMMDEMPKHKAPEGFEDRLTMNIQRFDRGENSIILNDDSFNWKRAAISLAAGILIAFTTIQYISFNQEAENTIIKTNSNGIIAKDTTNNNENKTFDKPLNLVKEKK